MLSSLLVWCPCSTWHWEDSSLVLVSDISLLCQPTPWEHICVHSWMLSWLAPPSEAMGHPTVFPSVWSLIRGLETGISQNILGKCMLTLWTISIHLTKQAAQFGSHVGPHCIIHGEVSKCLIQKHIIIAQYYYSIAPSIKISGSLEYSTSCSQQCLLEIHFILSFPFSLQPFPSLFKLCFTLNIVKSTGLSNRKCSIQTGPKKKNVFKRVRTEQMLYSSPHPDLRGPLP